MKRYKESELKSEQEVADKKSIEKDSQTALDIRRTAMGRQGEMGGDDQPKEEKSRTTSSDMFTFLQEKLEFNKERLRQKQERRKREAR